MGAPPQLNIRLDNPVNTIVDTATLPIRFGLATASSLKETVQDPLLESFGMKTQAQKDAEAQAEAATAESNARTQAYNDALADTSLDPQTVSEVKNLYASGATSGEIASHIAAAKEGKGVFAPRRIAQNESRLLTNQPGRRQIMNASGLGRSPTLGAGYKIGGGR